MFLNWVKKWQTLIKLVLFLSIASLVIVEITRLFKTISFDKIVEILGKLSPLNVICLALFGFIAVAPMIFYDSILNKELNQKQKLSYLLETSWTINSLNNMIGFAGLVDVGLRYSFYGDEERPEKSMQGISRVIPYFMSGFSLFALISLVLTELFPVSFDIKQYWPALLGASLYLPIVLLVSNRKKWVYFGQLDGKTILSLVLASALDWACVLSFFLFYHLSSISRHLIKNRLNSIIKLRNLSIFELRFSVKSVLKNNALPSDFFDKVLQSYGINNFTDFG